MYFCVSGGSFALESKYSWAALKVAGVYSYIGEKKNYSAQKCIDHIK